MRATAPCDDGADVPTSLTRADWLRIGASLAAVAPVVALGSQDAAVAAPNTGGRVTVLGAGGKTGRECVEYLASRGTGESQGMISLHSWY